MSQNVEAEKRCHIASSAPMSIGMTVVTTWASTWKSGRTMPSTSPRTTGTSSPSMRVSDMKLRWLSIAPLGRPVVPDV